MALDGITCQLLSDELNDKLSGVRIEKVFMPDKSTVILHFRGYSGIKKLLISINPNSPRVNLTDSTRENPAMPPSFCMLLRKYLAGAHIEKVTNPGYERIIEFHITNTDELRDTNNYRLIVELMGRFSNIILLNKGGKILDSAIHVDFRISRVREVMPARIYDYPPSQEKMLPEEAYETVKSGLLPIKEENSSRPIHKALLDSVKGMSPQVLRVLAHKAGIDDRKVPKDLTDSEKENLIKILANYFEQIVNRDYSPAVYYGDDDQPTDYSPTEMVGFKSVTKTETLSEAIDLFYADKDKNLDLENKKNRLLQIVNQALTKVIRKLETHRDEETEGLKADSYKLSGDLILSYQYKIKTGDKSLFCEDYNSDPPREIEIELDPRLSAADNAQEYYKRFRKARKKLTLAQEYLEEDKLAAEYLRSLKSMILAVDNEDDIKALDAEIRSEVSEKRPKHELKQNNGDPNRMVGKAKSGKASSRALREAAKRINNRNKHSDKSGKDKPLPYRKYETADGYLIYCGRNNIQNEELTFRVADRNDFWFHVKGLPGTHVILKSHPGEEFPSDEAVLEAASIAAYFSKKMVIEEHHMNAESKVEVDYCKVSHVKKIPGAKPGMVIYEGYYSINVTAKEPVNQKN